MSEHDVENTNQAPDGSEAQPDTGEDGAAQEGQQEGSATGQMAETAGDRHNDAPDESGSAGDGETSEQPPEGDDQDDSDQSSSQQDNTLTLDNASEIPYGVEDANSDEFTLTPDGDNVQGVSLPIDDSDASDPETVTVIGGTRGEGDEEGDNEPASEDSSLDYPEPEPETPIPADTEAGQSGLPVYKGFIDPRVANIQPRVDLSQLRADDDDGGGDDGEEEELQGIVARPDIERPKVDDQPAPGTGPFPPQPGQSGGLDVFDARLQTGDADGTQPAALDPRRTVDARETVSDLTFGDDGKITAPEQPALSDPLRFKPEIVTPRDASPAFDSDSGDDTLDEADIFPTSVPSIEPTIAGSPQEFTSAPMFKSHPSFTTDDEEDDDPEDDLDGDF